MARDSQNANVSHFDLPMIFLLSRTALTWQSVWSSTKLSTLEKPSQKLQKIMPIPCVCFFHTIVKMQSQLSTDARNDCGNCSKRKKKLNFMWPASPLRPHFLHQTKTWFPNWANRKWYICTSLNYVKNHISTKQRTLSSVEQNKTDWVKKIAHFTHIFCCIGWKRVVGMFQIDKEIDQILFQVNAFLDNTKIIGRSKNWLTLAFQESLAIKHLKPELNKGLKSCEELTLF